MQIELTNLGKRFNRQWIFRKLNFTFQSGNAYAIIGYNGSGKSTLLQIIAGAMEKSEGSFVYKNEKGLIQPEHIFRHVSFSAPYLELIEELTLTEFFEFHFQLKPIMPGLTISDVIAEVALTGARNKQIRQFSSGMKQRAKLGQAFFSHVPVLFLDEPTSNLDTTGIELYHRLVKDYGKERLLIICSNDEQEIHFCDHRIDITEYKESNK